jgi:hypothetical protein
MDYEKSLLVQRIKQFMLDNDTNRKLTHADLAERLCLSEDTVSQYARALSYPKTREHLFIETLGWSRQEMKLYRDDYDRNFSPKARKERVRSERYKVFSIGEYLGAGKSLDALNEEMDEILDFWPLPEGEGNNMGSRNNWDPIFFVSPDTGFVLTDKNKKIIGFWHTVAVHNAFYKRIIKGENINKDISSSDVVVIDDPGEYDMYFVDFFLHLSHHNQASKDMIFDSIFQFLESLANRGIFIKRISANVTSDLAETLCLKRGFVFKCDHIHHRVKFNPHRTEEPSRIYELNIEEYGADKLLASRNNILQMYKAHFSHTEGANGI